MVEADSAGAVTGPNPATGTPIAPEESGPPISLFASVMGLAALAIAWRMAAQQSAVPDFPGTLFAILAILGFLFVAARYAWNWHRRPNAVRAEFENAQSRNLFGMPLICLLLLPIVIAPVAFDVAFALWLVGVVGMLALAVVVVGRWASEPQQRTEVTTTRLIVAVGLLDIPLAMPALDLSTAGFGSLCFTSGLTLAAMIYTVILPRYLFEPPPPVSEAPTLLIAVAPLAVGCSSAVIVQPGSCLLAVTLLTLAVMLLAGLLVAVGRQLRGTSFHLSWWGASFPVAATAGAALRVAAGSPAMLASILSWGLLASATLLVAGLLVCTSQSVFGRITWRGLA